MAALVARTHATGGALQSACVHAYFVAIFVTFKVWQPIWGPPSCTMATNPVPLPTQAVQWALAAQIAPKVLQWAPTAAHRWAGVGHGAMGAQVKCHGAKPPWHPIGCN